mmetsp:Transcript_158902/g.509662  ORF Transcript_158902/g.509662 Transcript_158902/m.509662 type:complete len:441 (-) Transcript_158902:14-1336(-)
MHIQPAAVLQLDSPASCFCPLGGQHPAPAAVQLCPSDLASDDDGGPNVECGSFSRPTNCAGMHQVFGLQAVATAVVQDYPPATQSCIPLHHRAFQAVQLPPVAEPSDAHDVPGPELPVAACRRSRRRLRCRGLLRRRHSHPHRNAGACAGARQGPWRGRRKQHRRRRRRRRRQCRRKRRRHKRRRRCRSWHRRRCRRRRRRSRRRNRRRRRCRRHRRRRRWGKLLPGRWPDGSRSREYRRRRSHRQAVVRQVDDLVLVLVFLVDALPLRLHHQLLNVGRPEPQPLSSIHGDSPPAFRWIEVKESTRAAVQLWPQGQAHDAHPIARPQQRCRHGCWYRRRLKRPPRQHRLAAAIGVGVIVVAVVHVHPLLGGAATHRCGSTRPSSNQTRTVPSGTSCCRADLKPPFSSLLSRVHRHSRRWFVKVRGRSLSGRRGARCAGTS